METPESRINTNSNRNAKKGYIMEKGIGVLELVDRLRRCAYIEKMSIKHLSGWFIAAPTYEYKHTFGYHAWNHAEHVDWILNRLELLRGGHSGANVDPLLEQWLSVFLDAPNQYAFIRGSYLVLKKSLLDFYRETLERCDTAANALDVHLIKRIIPEIQEQIKWANGVLEQDPDPKTSAKWEQSLKEALSDMGGILVRTVHASGETQTFKLRKPFLLPNEIIFDDRIQNKPITPHEQKLKMSFEDAVVEQFRVFFNEVYAAAMAATIIFESFDKNIPWGFIRDITRQFWDETRHSQFGDIRLKELGLKPDRCNQTLFKYSLAMPLVNRLCYLTMMLEPHFMPRKKPRFNEYMEAGDVRSMLFADHDWSDEINHVKHGKFWLDELLKDDARDIDVLKEETQKIIDRIEGKHVDEMSPF